MIVPIKEWSVLRPARIAMRARRVQKNRPMESREAKPKVGMLEQFCAMLEHQAELMIRVNTPK